VAVSVSVSFVAVQPRHRTAIRTAKTLDGRRQRPTTTDGVTSDPEPRPGGRDLLL